ncbi:MAG: hypothetical protein M1500_00680 [Candidatus Marsarchaeota archaeon]|jgi:hypothetical protein|nr:hypothetical protein [Candidatus Marsarchaeota archaeon]MCL5112218.1 hypothetical protein [Candidatus Marsarchaeota archaeon]
MRAQMGVIEAGIAVIIIAGAASALTDVTYNASSLHRVESLSISNLEYDFPMLLRYNATIGNCFTSNDASCEAAWLRYIARAYGIGCLEYEYQGIYASSSGSNSCAMGSSRVTYCFVFRNDTVSCIYAVGG